MIENHVAQQLDVKVTSTRQDVSDCVLVVEPHVSAPAYVLEPQQMRVVKVRLGGQKVLWSQEVSLCEEKAEQVKLLKVRLHPPAAPYVTVLVLLSECASYNLVTSAHSFCRSRVKTVSLTSRCGVRSFVVSYPTYSKHW